MRPIQRRSALHLQRSASRGADDAEVVPHSICPLSERTEGFFCEVMIMTVSEKAVLLHGQGYNCAQSVLAACGEYTGMDEKTALAIAGGFGGGMRCGEMCGAVSGALMAVGLCCPYNDASDSEAKVKIATLAKALTRDFHDNFGCVRCLELKREGISCDELIAYEAAKAEKIIKEYK